jgi:predicted N-acetyltransferase YhbS
MPRFPIPVIVLARLAVDVHFRLPHQKIRLGSALVKDSLMRVVRASNEGGLRAMVVDPLNESARDFYLRFGFEPSPTDESQLFLPMSWIRASMVQAETERHN